MARDDLCGATRRAPRWAASARLRAQGLTFGAGDVLALAGATLIAYVLVGSGGGLVAQFRRLAGLVGSWDATSLAALRPSGHAVRDLIVLVVMLGFFAKREHYTARLPWWMTTHDILSAAAVALLLEEVLLLTTPDPQAGLSAPLLRWSVAAVLLLLGRAGGRLLLRRLDAWRLDTVLVASGDTATRVADALSRKPELGFRVVSTIATAAPRMEAAQQLRGAPAAAAVARLVAGYGGSLLAIAAVGTNDEATLRLATAARHARLPVALLRVNDAAASLTAPGHDLPAHDIAVSAFHPDLSRGIAQKVKLLLDLAGAACLLVLCAPLLLAIAWQVRRDGGPALFRHQRIGVNGRAFHCMKFRTMRTDADAALAEILARDPAAAAEWEATQKLRDDPRITPIGQVLRRTSLDELPQLFNVLRGEMSLVGPRPIVASEVRFYGKHIADYYEARPGITGLWQVSGRSDTSYPRRVQLDVSYVRNWALWHDIAILLKTVPVVLFRRGAV